MGTHYPGLDGLRALAFVLVFLSHYEYVSWFPGGVNFFFVLSGFLITGILWDTRDRPGRARNFYIRRTVRVFPLYYGVLLLIAAAYPFMRWDVHKAWLAWPLYLGNLLRLHQAFVPTGANFTVADAHLGSLRHPRIFLSLGHLWSLCVEEQFYFAWPFVVWAFPSRRTLIRIAGGVAVAFPVLRFTLHHFRPYTWGYPPFLYSCLQFDGLLLGALLALLWRGQHRAVLLRMSAVALPVLSAIAAISAIAVSHGHVNYFRYGHGFPDWFDWWGLALINLYGAFLLLRALDPGSLVYRCFTLKPLRWLGKVSYGAYVFHDLPHSIYRILVLKARHGSGQHAELLTSLLAFACTLVIAGVSYNTYETFFLNLKERWAPSSRRLLQTTTS